MRDSSFDIIQNDCSKIKINEKIFYLSREIFQISMTNLHGMKYRLELFLV